MFRGDNFILSIYSLILHFSPFILFICIDRAAALWTKHDPMETSHDVLLDRNACKSGKTQRVNISTQPFVLFMRI